MPILCRDLNLLFVMVPGTGCSGVACLLCDQFGGERLPNKHASLDQIIAEGALTRTEVDQLQVFATVRNPFDRFVTEYTRIAGTWFDEHFANDSPRSHWIHDKGPRYEKWKRRQQQKARERGFDSWLIGTVRRYEIRQFVRNPLQYRRRLDLLAYPMVEGVDRLMLYERLESELKAVLRDAGAEAEFSLPRRNVTPGKKSDYRDYYSPRSRAFVEKKFGAVLNRFGHSFDGPVAKS